MKRKLLKQISTEWRSNLWLVVELMLISSIMFFLVDFCASHFRMAQTSIGADITNVYRLTIGALDKESPAYISAIPENNETQTEADDRAAQNDVNRMLAALRDIPGIQAVAQSSSAPYNYNFNGTIIKFTDSIFHGQENYMNQYFVGKDYPLVMNIHGVGGETPEQLAALLAEGKTLISANSINPALLDSLGLDVTDLRNHTFRRNYDDDTKTYTVGAVINPIRRGDYEMAFAGTFMCPVNYLTGNIYIRVDESEANRVVDRLTANSSEMNFGNLYIMEVTPMETVRDDLHRDDNAELRNLYICMGFLLLTVFLGLLGTFWFRTQQRMAEIAIRKVAGATNLQVFMRLVQEGMILLTVATVPAWGIDALIVHAGMFYSALFFPDENMWLTALAEGCVVYILMALMIVGGIAFPARKAMNVEPADVLRGE